MTSEATSQPASAVPVAAFDLALPRKRSAVVGPDTRVGSRELFLQALNLFLEVAVTHCECLDLVGVDANRVLQCPGALGGVVVRVGDYGTAVDFARKVDPRSITAAERRARYWEDTALALQGRGRPTSAFDALLAAEHDVPEEVRYRPWAQQLTRELLSAPASHGLSGIREFAARVGVA